MQGLQAPKINPFFLSILLISLLSTAKAELQEPETRTFGTLPAALPGEVQLQRPVPPWSKWMTHRGRCLIAVDEGAVQIELFGNLPDPQHDDALNESRRNVQRLMREYRRQLQSIVNGIRYDALDDAEVKRVAAAFSQVNEIFEEKLKHTLAPDKWNRLKELTLWLSIRDLGLIECLTNDFGQDSPFAENSLRITPAQIASWKSHANTWQNEYTLELYRLEDFVTERLAESLRPEQQQLLQRRLGHDFSSGRHGDPSRQAEGATDLGRKSTPVPIYFSIPCATTRTLLTSLEYPSDFLDQHADPGVHGFPWRDFYLPTYGPSSMFNGDLVAFAKTAEVIELSPAQQHQLQDFEAQKEQHLGRLKQQWPLWNDRGSPHRDEFIAAYRRWEDEQAKKLYRDVLLPHQVDVLQIFLNTQRIRRYGLLPLLADGSLGRELEVTRVQRNDLFEQAPKIRAQLVDKLDELYQKLHQDVLAGLEPDQRRRVTQALGEIPTYTLRGEFTETLRQLRSPNQLDRTDDAK